MDLAVIILSRLLLVVMQNKQQGLPLWYRRSPRLAFACNFRVFMQTVWVSFQISNLLIRVDTRKSSLNVSEVWEFLLEINFLEKSSYNSNKQVGKGLII